MAGSSHRQDYVTPEVEIALPWNDDGILRHDSRDLRQHAQWVDRRPVLDEVSGYGGKRFLSFFGKPSTRFMVGD